METRLFLGLIFAAEKRRRINVWVEVHYECRNWRQRTHERIKSGQWYKTNLVLASVTGVCCTATRVLCGFYWILNTRRLLVTDVLNVNEVCITCPAPALRCRKRPCACHEGMWRSGVTAPVTLNLGARCGQVVSFMPGPLYRRDNSPRYPLNRRPTGAQRWSGRFRGCDSLLLLSGIEPQCRGCPCVACYADWAVMAPYRCGMSRCR